MPLVADLFNDGTLGVQWTARLQGAGHNNGSVLEEDASGLGGLVLRSPASGDVNAAQLLDDLGLLVQTPVTGDFDVGIPFEYDVLTAPIVAPGIGWRDGTNTINVWMEYSGTISRSAFLTHNIGAGWVVDQDEGTAQWGGMSGGIDRRVDVVRLRRVGNVFTFFMLDRDATWRQLGQVTLAVPAAGNLFLGGNSYSGSGTIPRFLFRGFLVLTAGALAVPAAPTGGLAFSAPSADDSDLGVGFSWAAPASNVARTVEVQTATNSGFTTGLQRHVVDLLMDGEKPSHRRANLSAGNTIYGRARFVDELGQTGTWSSTVSAAAAITPTSAVVYVPGVVRVIRRQVRVIRRATP